MQIRVVDDTTQEEGVCRNGDVNDGNAVAREARGEDALVGRVKYQASDALHIPAANMHQVYEQAS